MKRFLLLMLLACGRSPLDTPCDAGTVVTPENFACINLLPNGWCCDVTNDRCITPDGELKAAP